MQIFRSALMVSVLAAMPFAMSAQPQPTVRARRAPIACAIAARSIRDWGWGDGISSSPSTPLATIVSAVNYKLRLTSGQLSAEDIGKLKAALSSDDPCVRELSVTILAINRDGPAPKKPVVRLAESQKEKGEFRD